MKSEQTLYNKLIRAQTVLIDYIETLENELSSEADDAEALAADLRTVTKHRDKLLAKVNQVEARNENQSETISGMAAKLNAMGNITGKNLTDDIALAREFEQLAESCGTDTHKMAGWIDGIIGERDNALSAKETIEEEFDANVAGYQINIVNLEKWLSSARNDLAKEISERRDLLERNKIQEKMLTEIGEIVGYYNDGDDWDIAELKALIRDKTNPTLAFKIIKSQIAKLKLDHKEDVAQLKRYHNAEKGELTGCLDRITQELGLPRSYDISLLPGAVYDKACATRKLREKALKLEKELAQLKLDHKDLQHKRDHEWVELMAAKGDLKLSRREANDSKIRAEAHWAALKREKEEVAKLKSERNAVEAKLRAVIKALPVACDICAHGSIIGKKAPCYPDKCDRDDGWPMFGLMDTDANHRATANAEEELRDNMAKYQSWRMS